MKLIVIPPFQNPGEKWGPSLRERIAAYKKRGHFEGVEIDVDEGHPVEGEWDSVAAAKPSVTVGIVKRVKEYSQSGKYDGIVLTGCLGDPGFLAARSFCKIPVAAAVHSSFIIGSLIGERFTSIHGKDEACLIVRRYARECGFDHKLVSVRPCGHSPRDMYAAISKHQGNKEARARDPEIKKMVEDITATAIAAVEKERADSVILGVEPLNLLEDEVRQRMDERGYGEIPVIANVAAAVEMAKTLVSMRLVKATRAFPTNAIKVRPEHW